MKKVNYSEAIDSLGQTTPGSVPLELFNAIARISVTPVVETILSDKNAILLFKRPKNDKFWPNKLSLPGKIIASGLHNNIEYYVHDLVKKYSVKSYDAIPWKQKLVNTARGAELMLIYLCEVDHLEQAEQSLKVPIRDIISRPDIIDEHKEVIIEYFKTL